MGSVVLHMSISLDGFVAGPGVTAEHAMGKGGERLHEWLFADPLDPRDAGVADAMRADVGAVVLGNRTFTVGLPHWGGTPYPVPCFVLTHTARGPLQGGEHAFTFVTDGVESALRQAQAAAGDGDITLMGAEVAQQFLRVGLLDEIQLNVVPVLLGDGLRLFEGLGAGPVELGRLSVIESPAVTHLRFRVVRPTP